MFYYGTFGSNSAQGARYHRQCMLGLVVLVAGEIVFNVLYSRFAIPSFHRIAQILPGGAFAYIAWSLRRYLLALGELARRMQLEAMAWTYPTGLVAAMLPFGFGVSLNPAWFLALEPVRATWLVVISKGY